MRRNIVRGLVTRVEPINRFLTFVTLSPLEDEWTETRVPVYLELPTDIVGKPVDIVTIHSGLFRRKVNQEVNGSNFSYSVKFAQSQIDAIISSYRRLTANCS